MSDDSIEFLLAMSGLKTLNARWTRITPDDAEELDQLLPNCHIEYQQRTNP